MQNEVLKAIAERNSCRDFTGAPLTDGQVRAIADAALASPSGMNRQPWRVIIITDKALIEEMDAEAMRMLAAQDDRSTYDRFMERGGKMFYNAPCMVLIVSDGSSMASVDCGILSENVALAAHSMGLGNVICGMAAIPFTGPRADEFKRRAKFPDGYAFGMSVLAGAAASGKTPHELDQTKVIFVP